MGLHDIDKQTGGRIAPQPNTNDSVQQRMAQGTTQVQNSSDETETDGLKMLERQIIAVQDGENKAAFGFYGDANKFGFKVAEDGVDVLTATDDQLIFNSEQNVFKIVKTGTVPSAAYSPGVANLITIPHGLDHAPIVVGFMAVGSGYRMLPLFTSVNNGGGGFQSVDGWTYIESDATNIYISFNSAGTTAAAGTYNVKYYALQETAN